jgi:hypothetical protein
MRRKPAAIAETGSSLFTFLDGLICTMGALIVVLIVMVHQGKLQVQAARDAAASAPDDESEIHRSDLEWRIGLLREARDKTMAQLEEGRLALGHIEDHARRLRAQIEEQDLAHDELMRTLAGEEQEQDQLRSELADAQARLAASRRELDEKMNSAGTRSDSYAIVPYHGHNQTRRRPIYVECRADGIVFQPEGIVLTEKDFVGELEQNNPLASGLRAAREQMIRTRGSKPGDDGMPYPLLLVRPDGIGAYLAARAAMGSWSTEFGYELIEQDWTIEFPPPDPGMAMAMRQAVAEARWRMSYFARNAPRLMQYGDRPSFRVSSTGGGTADAGAGTTGDGSSSSGRPGRGQRGSGSGGSSDVGPLAIAQNSPGRGTARHGTMYGRADTNGTGRSGGSGAPADNSLVGPRYSQVSVDDSSFGDGSNSGSGAGSGTLGAGSPYAAALQGLGQSGGGSAQSGSSNGQGETGSARGSRYAQGGTGTGQDVRGNGRSGLASQGGAGIGPGGSGGDGLAQGGSDESQGELGPATVGSRYGGNLAQANVVPASTSARGDGAPFGVGGGRNGGGGTSQGGRAGQSNVVATGAGGASRDGSTTGGTGRSGSPSASNSKGNSPSSTLPPEEPLPNSPGPHSRYGSGSSTGGAADGVGGTGDTSGDATPGDENDVSGSSSGRGGTSGGSQRSSPSSGAGGNPRYAKISRGGGSSSGSGSSSSSTADSNSRFSSSTDSSAMNGNMGGGPGQPGQVGSMGMPMPTFNVGQPPASLAAQRGQNWANVKANEQYSKEDVVPIKIICDSDHLSLMPERGSGREIHVIKLAPRTADSVDELVNAVWDQVESWGSAGRGNYWRPKLVMEIAPGGEARFADLNALLKDSGLDVEGRTRAAKPAFQPREPAARKRGLAR